MMIFGMNISLKTKPDNQKVEETSAYLENLKKRREQIHEQLSRALSEVIRDQIKHE
jgi:hypothetical protein